jgi:hypothetical protein
MAAQAVDQSSDTRREATSQKHSPSLSESIETVILQAKHLLNRSFTPINQVSLVFPN